ncbi:hypothetical protein MANES_17G062800v8 [Manihot esculenta]|uniref:Uncharacterized protein n=1 Tax=Manihot esculenta TaxID=3983 RepID=A0A2C9U6A8_MANES|nr:hypothetical protein MANES_17G062800v8 [Manihot esculenta]
MGIQGLLPLLKSIMVPIHIKDLEGCSVAVDTYSWLHKGALSCSTQLCKGLPTSRIRKENLSRAIEHESNGNSAAAYECYQKAVDISPSIAHELIQILKQENVCYVVAPYEADAQMTFLAVSKQVDAVITEDSDLIPFGCPRIIFKMDKYGQAVEFHYSRLKQNKELSFSGFTHEMLLQMCILSGCDYLQSLPGMGLKRAHALVNKFKSYDKVIKHLRYSTVSVPPLYEESFQKAIWTFQHQRVYDPITEDIVHLSDISDNLGDNLDFLGPLIPQHIARGIAKGDVDPFTQTPFKEENTSSGAVLNRTSESKNFRPESGKKKVDLPVQKNLLTKYFCFASLEAKREFRAPRTSPINSSPVDKSSPGPKENCSVEAASSSIHCSSESPLDSENGGSTPPDDTVESGFAAEVLEFSESPTLGMTDEKGSFDDNLPQQFVHSMHKPYQALLKECDCKNVQMPNAVEDERTENKKVIVRSSYFNQKSTNKSAEDDNQEKLLVKNDVSYDPCDNVMLKSSYKTKTANNKIVIRSSYFQCKPVNKNRQANEQRRVLVKDDAAMGSEMKDDVILESASLENNGIPMKRKTSPNLQENMKSKHMRADASLSENGCCSPNLDETHTGQKTEGKFGSDISHIDDYSAIAEKSMERFVSAISSFRFSKSGSRASGLRAPLKDVQNTCTSRSNAGVDFSHFAYTSTNKKSQTGLALDRC